MKSLTIYNDLKRFLGNSSITVQPFTELDPTGHPAALGEHTEAPPTQAPPTRSEKQDSGLGKSNGRMDPSSVPALDTLVSLERLDEIRLLAEKHVSEDLSNGEGVSLGVIISKEERGHIHVALRLAYPQLKSISAKNASGETELRISADCDYWKLREVLEHDEVIRCPQASRISSPQTLPKTTAQRFVYETQGVMEERVHRLLDDIFGSKMVARTLTAEGQPKKRRKVEAHPSVSGEEVTRIVLRFRKHTSKATRKEASTYLKFVMKKTNLPSSPPATKRTSWSCSSSTRQATSLEGTSGLSTMSRGCADPTPSDVADGTDDAEHDESTSRCLLAASGLAIAPPTPDGSSETSESSLDDQTASEETPDISTSAYPCSPFSQHPLEHLRISGLGAVPKKNGKWRVILHFSAPEGLSINNFIAKEDCAIHYYTIDNAVALLCRFDKGARMAKDQPTCLESMITTLQVCETIVATEKCEGPAICITFLGIALDSSLQQLPGHRTGLLTAAASWASYWTPHCSSFLGIVLDSSLQQLPGHRTGLLTAAASWASHWTPHCSSSLGIVLDSSLQQLPGHSHGLTNAESPSESSSVTHQETTCILHSQSSPGRLSVSTSPHPPLNHSEEATSPHPSLPPDARTDLRWWSSFLPSWNGISMFLAPDWMDAESIQLNTDASGSFGFGAYLDGAWFRVAAALTWGHHLAGQRIRYHCDNLPIVQGLDQPVLRAGSDGTSKNPVLYRGPSTAPSLPAAGCVEVKKGCSGWCCAVSKEHQEAIQRLCSSLHLQPSQFSYAGIKDRRAITLQYVTARSVTVETMKSFEGGRGSYPGLQTGSYQYVPLPLRLGNLSGNEFVVTIRDVAVATPVPGGVGVKGVVEAGAVRVRERGFVNYFGPQRFGYQGVLGGVLSPHVGLALLKGNCMTAVKLLLYPELGEACDKSVLALISYFQATHDVSGTLERMPPSKTREGYILRALRRHGFTETGCQHSLMSLPHSLRLLYVHSLSSLLWNHLVSHRLREYGERVVEGDLVLNPSQGKTLRECVHVLSSLEASSGHYTIGDIVLPMVGTGTVFPGNRTAERLHQMLTELGLTLDCFRLRHFGMHVAGSYRKMVVCPRHMTWEWFDSRTLRLHFTLEPSCYATMLLGELTGGGVATHTTDQSDVDDAIEENVQLD
eukprot:Em0008g942a